MDRAEHRHDGPGRAAAEPGQRSRKRRGCLTDPEGMAISPRRITLSTSGIIPKIAELAKEPVRPKLAISLNASTEEQRQRADADHAQVSLEGSDRRVPRVSAAPVGKADVRVCAAEEA